MSPISGPTLMVMVGISGNSAFVHPQENGSVGEMMEPPGNVNVPLIPESET